MTFFNKAPTGIQQRPIPKQRGCGQEPLQPVHVQSVETPSDLEMLRKGLPYYRSLKKLRIFVRAP